MSAPQPADTGGPAWGACQIDPNERRCHTESLPSEAMRRANDLAEGGIYAFEFDFQEVCKSDEDESSVHLARNDHDGESGLRPGKRLDRGVYRRPDGPWCFGPQRGSEQSC